MLQVKELKNKQWRFSMLILYITNVQDFLLQLNCSICYLMHCVCDVTQLRLLWKPGILVPLRVFQIGKHLHCIALLWDSLLPPLLSSFASQLGDRWQRKSHGLEFARVRVDWKKGCWAETQKLQFSLQVALVSWVAFWSEEVFKC